MKGLHLAPEVLHRTGSVLRHLIQSGLELPSVLSIAYYNRRRGGYTESVSSTVILWVYERMNLVLDVIGKMAGNAGLKPKKSWSEQGGTIGRASGNDWVLPDPDRFVSGKHALISYLDGAFFVTDTSVNGIYVNGAAEALGAGNKVELKTGDTLAIGDYLIEVTVTEGHENQEINDAFDLEGFSASPEIEQVQPVNVVEGGGEDPLGLLLGGSDGNGVQSAKTDSFMLTQPTQPGPADTSSQKPLDAFFEAPVIKADPLLSEPLLKEEAPAAAPPSAFGIPEDWDADDANKALFPSEDPFSELPASSVQTPGGPPSAEQVFLEKGTGGNNESEPAPIPKRKPQPKPKPQPQSDPTPVQAGQPSGKEEEVVAQRRYPESFKAMQFGTESIEEQVAEKWLSMLPAILDAMMASMRSRAEIKNEMRVDKTMLAAAENNPLKFSVNAQSAANNLFVDQSGSFLSPEQAFNEAFHDIQVHQIALMTAMQHTIREMMERFNPKKLEKRFEKGMKRKPLFGSSNKSAYWDLYTERYNELCEDSDKLFHELVSDVFAEAYDKAVRELK